MRTYTLKPENRSRTLDSPTRASRQASISDILKTYAHPIPEDRLPVHRKESGSTHSPTLQRVVEIGEATYDEKNQQTLIDAVKTHFSRGGSQEIPQEIDLFIQQQVSEACQPEMVSRFRDINDYIYFIQTRITQQEVLKREVPNAAEWWAHPDTEGFFTLDKEDPLFKELSHLIMQSHREEPYATDALHETGAIMQAYMHKQTASFLRAVMASLSSDAKAETDRPDFEITRVQLIKNRRFLAEYERARRDMEARPGHPDAHERGLFSGHGAAGMEHISVHSHDPSYGQYDSQKGHGAHGRGAYFTGQVDKALSYSSSGQGPEEERSFFLQRVLLGNSFTYRKRGKFRHQHHNEMVRPDRSRRNKTRTEGLPQAPADSALLRDFDSLTGLKTSTPGNGLWGTIRDREKFDSEEYMVRNADQVYVQFRIYYKLCPSPKAPGAPLPSETGPIPPRPLKADMSHLLSTVPTSGLLPGGGRTQPALPTTSGSSSTSSLSSPLSTGGLPFIGGAAALPPRVTVDGDTYIVDGTRRYNTLDNPGTPGMCLWNIFLHKGVSEVHLRQAAAAAGVAYEDYVPIDNLTALVDAVNEAAGTQYVIRLDVFQYTGTYNELDSHAYGHGTTDVYIGLVFLEGDGHYIEKRP